MTSVLNPVGEDFAVAKVPAQQEMSSFAKNIYEGKYALKDEAGKVLETWPDTALRVVSNVMAALDYKPGDFEFERILDYVTERKFLPGGRYLYASGRELHQVQNCLLLKAEDSREGWAELWYKAGMALMTGAGIGVDYSSIRAEGSPIKKTGGFATGPIALMQTVNEQGRQIMQGGTRRSAIWAGLNWKHADVKKFIRIKDWSEEARKLKQENPDFPLPMELTNVSVLLDDEFFDAYFNPTSERHEWAQDVYWLTVKKMVKTGEPGFSIDVGENVGETLRNACTEITSTDDSDICNLGSINLARIETLEEFVDVIEAATLFLLAGTVYSHLPYDKVAEVRTKNRRLGLGIMGVHDWLLQRGYSYEPVEELGTWLEAYHQSTTIAARYAASHGLTAPIKTRAIAPTGTIGIIAETTTGIEPLFCVAYKRRYLNNNERHFEYVVDPTAKRLVDNGVDPSTIEDAYLLSYAPERRLAFQAWVQTYVDHGISSTMNLHAPITDLAEVREFGEMLLPYLPKLRGITVYPNGARGGQPLTAIPYQVAIEHSGVVFEEAEDRCNTGACGL